MVTHQTDDERQAEFDQLPLETRTQLNLLAGIEHQLTRIADRLGKPEQHIASEQALEAWRSQLRIYEDKAIPYLESLGIIVD